MTKRQTERIMRRAEDERRIIDRYLWSEDAILLKVRDWQEIMFAILTTVSKINEGIYTDAEAIVRLLGAEEAMDRAMWNRGMPRTIGERMQGYLERNPMPTGDAESVRGG